jgi:hypothetical protein
MITPSDGLKGAEERLVRRRSTHNLKQLRAHAQRAAWPVARASHKRVAYPGGTHSRPCIDKEDREAHVRAMPRTTARERKRAETVCWMVSKRAWWGARERTCRRLQSRWAQRGVSCPWFTDALAHRRAWAPSSYQRKSAQHLSSRVCRGPGTRLARRVRGLTTPGMLPLSAFPALLPL